MFFERTGEGWWVVTLCNVFVIGYRVFGVDPVGRRVPRFGWEVPGSGLSRVPRFGNYTVKWKSAGELSAFVGFAT